MSKQSELLNYLTWSEFSSPVPRQNDDQPSNQHFASRPVTLLKVKFSCSQSFGEGQPPETSALSIFATTTRTARISDWGRERQTQELAP